MKIKSRRINDGAEENYVRNCEILPQHNAKVLQ